MQVYEFVITAFHYHLPPSFDDHGGREGEGGSEGGSDAKWRNALRSLNNF